MKRKILALLLSMVMLIGMLPTMAFAEGEAVAKIGETEYTTLQAAVTSAEESDEIKLIENVTLTGDEEITIPENKKITIEGDGHTISFEKKSVFNKSGLTGAIQLTVSNVTFIGTNASTASYPVVTGRNFTGSVTLDSCTFKNIRKCAVYMDPNGTEEAALTIKNCTYDNTPIGYSIDMSRPATEKFNVAVTFTGNKGYTTEFEVFNNMVAVVQDSDGKFKGQYATLAEAIAAVDNGQTITVLKNIDDATGLTINTGKTFTIDFDGHTYTVNAPAVGSTGTKNQAFHIDQGQTITMKNGTVKIGEANTTAASGKISRVIQNYANLTLDNMKFDDTNLAWRENSEVAPGTLTSDSMIECDNGTVSLINGTTLTIADENKGSRYAFAMEDWPKGGYSDGVQVKIDGAAINGHIRFYSDGQRTGENLKSTLTIKTNTINGKIHDAAQGVTGGKITETIDGYGLRKYSTYENGTIYEIGADVAKVGGVGYTTLAKAFAAANKADTATTITMIADTTFNYNAKVYTTVESGKDITLDLNGKVITSSGTGAGEQNSALIENKGTLTIKDSAGKDENGHYKGKIIHAADPTWEYGGDGNYSSSYQSNVIYNNPGTLYIEGGHLENASTAGSNGGAAYVVDNSSNLGASTTVINDGELVANWTALRLFANSTAENIMTINGGTVNAKRNAVMLHVTSAANKADLTINAGTFTTDKTGASGTSAPIQLWQTGATTLASVNVTGGYFKAAGGAKQKIVELDFTGDTTGSEAKKAIQISGGYYNLNDTSLVDYIAPDYECVENTGNNCGTYPYVVQPIPPVAQISDGQTTRAYTTLAAAVAAAIPGDTITLLASCTGDGIQINKSLTIDLNEKAYTVNGNLTGSTGTKTQAFQLLKGNTITFKNGTITTTAEANAKMLIQNYANLTLDGVTLNGTKLTDSKPVLSNNCGTVNITGNTSITAAAGKTAFDAYYWPNGGYPEGVTVNINTTGTIKGTVELNADNTAQEYKNTVSISNGNFNGSFNVAKGKLVITGGYYTNDVSAYVANGYKCISNDDATYKYKVVANDVSVSDVEVKDDKIVISGSDTKVTVTEGANLTTVANKINEILNNEALSTVETNIKNAVDEGRVVADLKEKAPADVKGNVTKSDNEYVEVELTAVDVVVSEDNKITSMTFDVQPMAMTTVTNTSGTSVTVTAPISNDAIDGLITFRLPVADGYNTASLSHKGSVDAEFTLLGTFPVQGENGNRYIEASASEFSLYKYELLDAGNAVARIGEETDAKYYASLANAIDAAQPEDNTITLLKDSESGEITVNKEVTFTLILNGKTLNATIVAGEGYTLSRSRNTYTVKEYVAPSYSGGGSTTYAVTVESAKNGKLTADKKNASAGSTVTITVAPDKGFTLETLTVTDKNGKEITVKNLGNNKFSFKMPASKVTVEATFMEDNTMLNFFVDVPATEYYYDAVLWAAESGITNGVDAVHFGPEAPVTRGQVVTFLWRAAGKPVVNYYMNMSDVKSGEYYSEAVRWALSEGITKGTTDTTFEPETVCTRGQIVTFLARFAGVKDAETESVFTDVPATEFFAAAVKWAKDNGVTSGVTETTFEPYTNCNRAQVVTFLYRWMVK